jgi:putative membrane protein
MVRAALLSPEEHARLTRAIAQAEATTTGEIYAVVAQACDDFRLVPVLWAALFALLLPWVLHIGTALSLTTILGVQVLAFIAAIAVLSLPQLRYRIVPASMAEDAAHQAAVAQFMAHGVHMTETRTGVLIYVCMAPHRIEVIADSGIHEKVGEQEWQELVAEIAREARDGRLSDGLTAAIARTGALLARHFPCSARNPNELPDRVLEM